MYDFAGDRPKLNPDDIIAAAQESLAVYIGVFRPDFQHVRHVSLICDHLEAVERGEIRRLMIHMPPRHGKSLLASTFFPAWYFGKHPDRSIICASYGQDLSDDFGRRVRNLAAQPLHKAIFPACLLAEDSSSMRRFNSSVGGSYYAVGRGGPITGRGANLLLIDDPLKDADEARSETIRHALHEWYASVAYTRLQPGAAIVLIQTRWHQADLAGWLLMEHAGENWTVLSLPAIAEPRDPLGRAEGQPLWPEMFGLPMLEQIRTAIGSSAWTSLYQQRPSAAEGQILKRQWWQRYSTPPPFSRIVCSWDCAFKKTTTADYTVCTTWGQAENGFYLLHLSRGRVEFPEMKRLMQQFAAQWKPAAILIEDTASGQSAIQTLKVESTLPIIPVKPDSDKIARAQAITPLLEAGKVFIPESSAPWLSDLLDETAAFPNAAHDDIVDSVSQALAYLRGPGFILGVVELGKRILEFGWSILDPTPEQREQQAAIAAKIRAAEKRLMSPLPHPVSPGSCPKCGAQCIARVAGRLHCNQCGLMFGPPARTLASDGYSPRLY